jgi:hypothetical protein
VRPMDRAELIAAALAAYLAGSAGHDGDDALSDLIISLWREATADDVERALALIALPLRATNENALPLPD